MSLPSDAPVVVGRIQAPYGIKGWVHVIAFTDPKENLLQYKPWQLEKSAGGKVWQEIEVEQIRPHKQGFVARLSGVTDRNAAQALKGRLIGVSAHEFPVPPTGEYYWRDLIGAEVVQVNGTPVGRVDNLLETGAHDVLIIRQASGAEVLIPFHESYVIEVSTADGLIRVDWSEPESDSLSESFSESFTDSEDG